MFDKLKVNILAIKKSIDRFPITMILSFITLLLLIYSDSRDFLDSNIINRLTMTSFMAIILSLNIHLIMEKEIIDSNLKKYTLCGIGDLILIVNFILLGSLNYQATSRYIGLIIILILGIFYIPWINNRSLKEAENYEINIIKFIGEIQISLIYYIILQLGIFFIYFTVERLFNLNLGSRVYLYTFYILVFLILIPLMIARLPSKENIYANHKYPKSLKVLLTYIFIPLILIYTLILYIYFGGIALSREWPSGLVSHLVIWYSSLSIGIIILLEPIIQENKLSNIFKKTFPKIILPILIMMFISIGIRIGQYGFTENRYNIVLLGLWTFMIMLYYTIKNKKTNNLFIPISLSIFIFISIIGPQSSYSVSKYSQNNRLENTLIDYGVLENGRILIRDLSADQIREISNIIDYFDVNHSLSNIRILDEDFELKDMKKVFGFQYAPDIYGYNIYNRYFYVERKSREEIIKIEEYQYIFNLNAYDILNIRDLGFNIKYSNDSRLLYISTQDKDISIDLNNIIVEGLSIGEKITSHRGGFNSLESKEMEYILEDENYKIKFLFSEIMGTIELDEKIRVEGFTTLVFISIK